MYSRVIKFLVHGIDTLVCAYYLAPGKPTINFELLIAQREFLRQSKAKASAPLTIAGVEFLLRPYGSSSGYPIVLENEDFKIECGEFNKPNFYVTFRSQALWRESAWHLHEKFLGWAKAAGFSQYHNEALSRVDYCFDYYLPTIDFCEDNFLSRSSKDSQHREYGKVQTFSFGKGDIVCRVYDKVAEIEQQSCKIWFFLVWGMDKDVWRIEWQMRKAFLKSFDIYTFQDFQSKQGDILSYLADEHDSLRIPNSDTNSSRWPLHPLWIDLRSKIAELNSLGVNRVFGRPAAMEERMQRIAISIYGYFKSIAAIQCVQGKKDFLGLAEAMDSFIPRLYELYEPITWQDEVEKRINDIRCGEW